MGLTVAGGGRHYQSAATPVVCHCGTWNWAPGGERVGEHNGFDVAKGGVHEAGEYVVVRRDCERDGGDFRHFGEEALPGVGDDSHAEVTQENVHMPFERTEESNERLHLARGKDAVHHGRLLGPEARGSTAATPRCGGGEHASTHGSGCDAADLGEDFCELDAGNTEYCARRGKVRNKLRSIRQLDCEGRGERAWLRPGALRREEDANAIIFNKAVGRRVAAAASGYAAGDKVYSAGMRVQKREAVGWRGDVVEMRCYARECAGGGA